MARKKEPRMWPVQDAKARFSDERGPRSALGSRLAARFARAGLRPEIAELRGHSVRPAEIEE